MGKHLIIFVLVFSMLSSCVNTKKAAYFANLRDSTVFNDLNIPEYVIQKNDLLSITVNSINPDASRIFNLPNKQEIRSSTPTGTVLEPAGYLVNNEGFIKFLMIGSILAEGSTKEQLQTTIRDAITERKLLIDPVVEVRHLNFRVTVLGEVTRPNVITVTNEKITLLEAIGLAGDLTIFGKRNDVLIIRTEGGKRIANRVNLNTTELINSPYYYLRPNDVIYVEPNPARVQTSSRIIPLLPAIVSSLSVMIVVIDRLTR
jgi:polysaccharide export outer membrane protein